MRIVGCLVLVRFLCDVLITRPVFGVGGAQDEQGRMLQVCLPHTFYIRFHLSLCQRNCEQARLVHLTVIAVPVPEIREQIVDVIKAILEEWMPKRIVQQIVHVPVPQIPEQIVEVILGGLWFACTSDSTGGRTPGAEC